MKKNKMIVGIDNDIYNDFANICRKQGVNIPDKLNEIMKKAIKKYNKNE